MINPFFEDEDFSFEAYAQRLGCDDETLATMEALSDAPEAVEAMQSWIRKWSESYRIAAVQADGGNAWLEKVGAWKALQEFADALSSRLNQWRDLQQGYRDVQNRRLQNH